MLGNDPFDIGNDPGSELPVASGVDLSREWREFIETASSLSILNDYDPVLLSQSDNIFGLEWQTPTDWEGAAVKIFAKSLTGSALNVSGLAVFGHVKPNEPTIIRMGFGPNTVWPADLIVFTAHMVIATTDGDVRGTTKGILVQFLADPV